MCSGPMCPIHSASHHAHFLQTPGPDVVPEFCAGVCEGRCCRNGTQPAQDGLEGRVSCGCWALAPACSLDVVLLSFRLAAFSLAASS